jgi:hypothetical protein
MLSDDEIGGGRARIMFYVENGTPYPTPYPPKRHLTRAEVMAMPIRNRQALIRAGYLKVYPREAGKL